MTRYVPTQDPRFDHEARAVWSRQGAEKIAARRIPVDINKITFGVEIECGLPYSYEFERGGYHNGVPLPEDFPDGWEAQSDSTVEFSDLKPVEIVSPPLHGADGIAEVVAVIRTIARLGGKTNQTCGFHVHIGLESVMGRQWNDLDAVASWVSRLVSLVAANEEGLLAITGTPSRLGNQYCRSVKEVWKGAKARDKWVGRVERRVHNASHYHLINVGHLLDGRPERRTVEFRVFAGTLKPEKIVGYLVTALGLVERAARRPHSVRVPEPKFYDQVDWPAAEKALRRALRGFGWPAGVEAEWGEKVKANQEWNAAHFAQLFRERGR